jgi:biopolymer transport protein ExbD
MARKKAEWDQVKLEMTPMIDVVFQLLIFFVVTLKQEDILAHLDVSRPAPDPNARPEEQVDLLTILVGPQGYGLQGKLVGIQELDRQLNRVAGFSKNTTVLIKCSMDSPHSKLVQLLDVCAKAGLTKLSVFSM